MRIAMFEDDPTMSFYHRLPAWLQPDHLVIRRDIDLTKDNIVQLKNASLDFKNASVMDNRGMVKQFTVQAIEYNADQYAFSGLDFRFDNGTESGIFQSGGLFDISLLSGDGKELKLVEGSSIELQYPLDQSLSGSDVRAMKIYSYDEKKQQWIYESAPRIIKKGAKQYFSFKLTHLSFWNIDAPITEHTCLSGNLEIEGSQKPRIVTILAEGLDYRGTTRIIATNTKPFRLDVKRDSEVSILAYTGENEGYFLPLIRTGKQMASSMKLYRETSYEIASDLDQLRCVTNQYTSTNQWQSNQYSDGYQYGTGGYVLAILSNQADLYKWEKQTYTNAIYWLITRAPSTNNTWVTNHHEQYLYSDRLLPLRGRSEHNESSGNYMSDLKMGKWIGYYYCTLNRESVAVTIGGKCNDIGKIRLTKPGYKEMADYYGEKKLKTVK